MKTLTTLLLIIVLALLGMSFYLNGKIEKLEAQLVVADSLNVLKKTNLQGHLSVYGDITNYGTYRNWDIEISENQILAGYTSSSNKTFITNNGIHFKNEGYPYTVKLSALGISFFKVNKMTQEYEFISNTPWDRLLIN